MKNQKYFLLLAIIFLLTLSLPLINASPMDYGRAKVSVSLVSQLDSDANILLKANLSLIPLGDERQTILSTIPFPSATQYDASYYYTWGSTNHVVFGWDAVFETSLHLYNLEEKKFPMQISQYEEFKEATTYIDITDDIRRKANELVSGKTDFNSAVLALAEFVNTNLTYDISLFGQNTKASVVLVDKRGVCSQYSTLFIALARALKIPTRYVTGVAYSNTNNNFGNHAWAEVYNGEIWLPIDPTYGEYFYLDSSHIALSKLNDIENGVSFSYTPQTSIDIKEINITASSQELEKPEQKISITLEPYLDSFAANSYIPLKVSVENPYDFVLPAALTLTKAPGVYGNSEKTILVPPKSTKSAYFILEIPDAEPSYLYSSNVEVKTQFGDSALTAVIFATNYESVSLEKALSIVASEEEAVNYIDDVSFLCTSSTKYYGKDSLLRCNVTSNANIPLYNLNICFENECHKIDLPINSETNLSFNFTPERKQYNIELRNFNKEIPLDLIFLEKPEPKIISLVPDLLDYKTNNVSISLKTNSSADCILYLNNQKYEIANLTSQIYELEFSGKDALNGKVDAKLSCKDLENQAYTDEKIFDVTISNIPFFARIKLFFINLFRR